METMAPDNWYDLHHGKEQPNLLKHFADKELQAELDRRQAGRRELEIMKIIGPREAVGYFNVAIGGGGYGGHREFHNEWELNIVFSNATKHKFTFSSKVGQTAETMEDFRNLYFPNLTRLGYDDYQRMVEAKGRLRKKKKKKICQSQP